MLGHFTKIALFIILQLEILYAYYELKIKVLSKNIEIMTISIIYYRYTYIAAERLIKGYLCLDLCGEK